MSEKSFVPPTEVRKQAKLGLELRKNGFEGGTTTGWNRGAQLANDATIPISDLAVMRAWYARHGPDAKNGGTSYPGYLKWKNNKKPKTATKENKDRYRGAVSWLIWGGDAAYLWLKTEKIRTALKKAYPDRKTATAENNLQ